MRTTGRRRENFEDIDLFMPQFAVTLCRPKEYRKKQESNSEISIPYCRYRWVSAISHWGRSVVAVKRQYYAARTKDGSGHTR